MDFMTTLIAVITTVSALASAVFRWMAENR
jgi:hypothetical protein